MTQHSDKTDYCFSVESLHTQFNSPGSFRHPSNRTKLAAIYLTLSIVNMVFGWEVRCDNTYLQGLLQVLLEQAGRLSACLCQAADQERLVSQGTGDISQQNTFRDSPHAGILRA